MKTGQLYPILLSLVAAFFGAWAQFFYKNAAAKLFSVHIIKNYHLYFGLISFFVVLVLFMTAFRLGGRMLVIYPVYATTYIWNGIIASTLGKEQFNFWQILGTTFIILGVSVISLNDQLS